MSPNVFPLSLVNCLGCLHPKRLRLRFFREAQGEVQFKEREAKQLTADGWVLIACQKQWEKEDMMIEMLASEKDQV